MIIPEIATSLCAPIAPDPRNDTPSGEYICAWGWSALFPIFGMMLVLSVSVLSLSGCGGGSSESTEDPAAADAVEQSVEAGEGATTAIGVAAQLTAVVQTSADPVTAFIERYKFIHANKDAAALADLFYFGDTPSFLIQTSTIREQLRFKRTLETVEFIDTYDPIPIDFNGDNYGPNIEVVGTLRRVFAPMDGMVSEVFDPIGIHEGTVYFPGLQLD